MIQPTTTPLPIGAPAADVALQLPDGSRVQLAQYWQRSPALLFFVRHVGCVFCREQVRLLARRHDELRSRGVEVVAVVPTDAVNAGRFARGMHLPFAVLADLPRFAFAAYGLYEAPIGEILQPEVLLRTGREWLRGNVGRINPFSSSFTQLGGVFVVDTGGTVRFGHAASPVYAYPSIDMYLSVLDNVPSVSGPSVPEHAAERQG
jgi:peroxiredoxin